MPDYQTFSLTTILNTHQLQPQLYQHMIHEIKSPLQEQSFDLTNDDSYCTQRVPRRPNIPPPPPQSPLAQLNNHQFSRTHQSMSIDIQQSRKKPKQVVRDEVMESIVSPLQYQINMVNEPSKQNSFFQFCGGGLESFLNSEQMHEIELPTRSKSYKRRPIFDRIKINKPQKTLAQALNKLENVDQPELTFFLRLMGALEEQLKNISQNKMQIEDNLLLIYQKLSLQTQYAPQVSQQNDTHSRILRRLRSRNTGQAINKIFYKPNKQNSSGQQFMETLFSGLNRIENVITSFIRQENSLNHLNTVFQFLQHNFPYSANFKDQLSQLYQTLSIPLSTDGLELIWDKCGSKILQKDEFIEGLSLNDCVVRQQKGFQTELSAKGFSRNQ